MTEFASKYTNANVASDAAQYSPTLFLGLHETLTTLASDSLATALLTAIICAQGRGDTVPHLFRDVTSQPQADIEETFRTVREAITLIVPFAGLPNTMPACFGLVNELKTRGIEGVDGPRRTNFGQADYTAHGQETVSTIYRGVGNSEVRDMIQQYFPEMSYFGRTTIWGYLVGSSPVFELKHAELIIAAAITGLGAMRQVKSHVKCAISVGNSVQVVSAVVEAAREIAAWNGRVFGEVDVGLLEGELKRNLDSLEG
ncbi:hypothetical protein BDV18DRAFT_159692 [Aspergillus unguis]